MHKHAITTREFARREGYEEDGAYVTDGGKQLGEGPTPLKERRAVGVS